MLGVQGRGKYYPPLPKTLAVFYYNKENQMIE